MSVWQVRIAHIFEIRSFPRSCSWKAVLCPSPGCWIRVITSEPESKSKQNASPSHESSTPHIFNIYLPKHKNKQQNVLNVRVNSATRHGRYCLDSGHRVTISKSESESKWEKKMDSSQSQSKIDSSHTALVKSQASEPSPSGNWGIYKLRYIYANVGETE